MTDLTMRKANEAIAELRKVAEHVNSKSSENEEKLEKINADIDKFQAENQKIYLEKKALEDKVKDQEAKLEDLEKKFSRPGAFGDSSASAYSPEERFKTDTFVKALKHGKDFMYSPEEMKYLRTDNDPNGGYLAPPKYAEELLKKIIEISPIRAFARTTSVDRGSLELPIRNELVDAFWVGEAGRTTNSNSKYGINVIKVNKLSAATPFTLEMMGDSAFNIEQELQADAAKAIALAEGIAYTSGNGDEKPKGFLADPNVEIIYNGSTTDIDFDKLIDLRSSLKSGYRGVYFANRFTIGNLRKKQDGNGRYLMDFFTQTGVPVTIMGDPLIEIPAMPDIAPGSWPILYGDLNEGYRIVDGPQISVIRDMTSLIDQGMVKYNWFVRTGGQVVMSEAIKKLEMSTPSV